MLANHLLKSLPAGDYALVEPHLEEIDLPFKFQLEISNRPIEHIYFPDDGLVSVVAFGVENVQIEVGIIGRDGMTGHAAMLGTDRTPNSSYMQIPGRGRRISTSQFLEAARVSPDIRHLSLKFIQAFAVQASYTALANGRANLAARLARWLIMAHDRCDGNELPLTHEFLSIMLGVRRPGITEAIQRFESSGLIGSRRGVIILKNRSAMIQLADGIYGVPEEEQKRLTGWISIHA